MNLTLYHKKLDEWAVEIIRTIDAELGKRVLHPDGNESEDTRMTRQIFTLGELAQICPHLINKRLFLLIESIVFQQGRSKRSRKDLPRLVTTINFVSKMKTKRDDFNFFFNFLIILMQITLRIVGYTFLSN